MDRPRRPAKKRGLGGAPIAASTFQMAAGFRRTSRPGRRPSAGLEKDPCNLFRGDELTRGTSCLGCTCPRRGRRRRTPSVQESTSTTNAASRRPELHRCSDERRGTCLSSPRLRPRTCRCFRRRPKSRSRLRLGTCRRCACTPPRRTSSTRTRRCCCTRRLGPFAFPAELSPAYMPPRRSKARLLSSTPFRLAARSASTPATMKAVWPKGARRCGATTSSRTSPTPRMPFIARGPWRPEAAALESVWLLIGVSLCRARAWRRVVVS